MIKTRNSREKKREREKLIKEKKYIQKDVAKNRQRKIVKILRAEVCKSLYQKV